MANARDEVLDWAAQGRIAPGRVRAALEATGALPDSDHWRSFLDRMFLFSGAVLLGAGAIFFVAYNWNHLGRYGRFALAEVPVLLALGLAWKLDLERLPGKAALFAAALLVGALLALVGQTYQTGADTFELFAAWAVAILPWVLVARLPALWIFWLLLVNLAAAFYFQTFGRFFGLLFAPEKSMWIHFALNTAALAIWEGLAASGVAWLRERWSVRILATASGTLVTILAVISIVGWGREDGWALLAWIAWMGAAYFVYRQYMPDLFVLAGGVLSAIVVVVTVLGKNMKFDAPGVLLFMALVVIGMSAAGGWWLRQVAREES